MRWRSAIATMLMMGAATMHAQDVVTRVSGTVYDSLSRRHLISAIVQIARVDSPAVVRSAVSDDEGRFAFDSVRAGQWLLGFFHPTIDSLGLEMPTMHLQIRTPAPIRAMLTTPSAQTLTRATCGPLPPGMGLWYGRARDATTGGLAPGAVVVAQWSTLVVRGKEIQRERGTMEDTARVDGLFALCGIATEEIVLSQGWRGADSSGVASVTVPKDGLLYRDLWLAPVTVAERRVVADSALGDSIAVPVRIGDRSLRGRVTRSNGAPVSGARLRVPEAGREGVTNADGYFALDSLPAGTQTIDARAIGLLPVVRTIDLAARLPERVDFVMESRGTFLDTVKVLGQRVLENPRYADFLDRKRRGFGYFMDEDQIERRQPFFLADLLRLTPGVSVLPSTFGGGSIRMRSLGAVGLCSPAVFIDGMMMTQIEGLDIEQFVNVQDVRSLEVYVRNTQIPVQFQTQNNCGSIVITTGMRRRPLPP